MRLLEGTENSKIKRCRSMRHVDAMQFISRNNVRVLAFIEKRNSGGWSTIQLRKLKGEISGSEGWLGPRGSLVNKRC